MALLRTPPQPDSMEQVVEEAIAEESGTVLSLKKDVAAAETVSQQAAVVDPKSFPA